MILDEQEVREQVAQVDGLLTAVEALEDSSARETAAAAVQGILSLYGESLARVMQTASELGGEPLLRAFANDELLSHLLLIHGLHPDDVETRVRRAIEDVNPFLAAQGASADLLSVAGGVVRLRFQSRGAGCHSSGGALKSALEQAVQDAAPDLDGLEIVELNESSPRLINISELLNSVPAGAVPKLHPDSEAFWAVAGSLPQLSGGGMLTKQVSGNPVLFLRLETDVFAYQHECPGCGENLERGALKSPEIRCAGCGRRFDVREGGTCLDSPDLALNAIPLQVSETGIVRVAVPNAGG